MKLMKSIQISTIIGALLLMCLGCSDDGLYSPETRVGNIQAASDALNKAFEEGKIVKSVLPKDGNGWIIRFKDDTSINFSSDDLMNNTPYITIGSDSCWYISEDQGDTYTYLKGSNDRNVNAFDSIIGSDRILSDVVMPKEESQSLIKAISEDNYAHTLSIGLNDGNIFKFPKTDNVFYTFSIEQKDNKVNIPNDFIYCIGMNKLVAISPYLIDKSHLVARFSTPDNNKVYVRNVEQISGVNDNDFSDGVNYHIISPDGDNNNIKIYLQNTGLPVVCINTPDSKPITSKTEWMDDAEITIYNANGSINYSDNKLQIRGRGNSTWSFPKKPYALKLNKKAEILGMPKHKRWVLLANWMDRTLLRNDFAFEIARNTGLEWTPRGQFVEVILNGNHLGNYYLCEQIKVDKNRVDIAELTEKDIEGENITGGYLMELDVYYDEVNKFKSKIRELPYMFKEPDEDVLQPVQFKYMEDFVNQMEELLYSADWLEKREYEKYMDLNSFVDWWFIYELSMNSEPNHPKSSYVHKDRNGKLSAGPVWDFDYWTFMPINTNRFGIIEAIYYDRLFQDPEFVKIVKKRWQTLKPKFKSVPNKIRSQASIIRHSERFNHELWPIWITVNDDVDLSFKDAVNRMINAYESKLSWLDQRIQGL